MPDLAVVTIGEGNAGPLSMQSLDQVSMERADI